jgi:hypothetical protein
MTNTEVVFAFDEGAGGVTNFFTLNDPVQGVLDNTVFTLGGSFSLVDVTQYVRSVSISRGRSRVLDRPQSGNASIVLDNRARLFDPTAGTAVSPYSSSIVPRKNVSITLNSEPIFNGLVDDWNLEFRNDGDYTTTAECVDGFLLLSQVTIGTAAKTSQLSGARVGVALTEASWPTGKRDLDAGQVTLQADSPAANTSILDYLQTVSDTEFGTFFMDRAGNAAFADRQASQNFSNPTVFGGTGIPFREVSIDYGSEQIYNEITLTRNNGGTAVDVDATSQTTYGVSELSKTGLLFNTDADMGTLGDYLLARYKDPALRINEVTVSMDALGTAQQSTVARLDVGSPLQVTFTPTVGSAITQYAVLDRISHNISPGEHNVTLTMSRAEASFILDSSLFGQLDDDQLGF